ncbi:MAG: hypothetical protein J3K34DRAFT_167785 [Monoraphidium minutum]|nr:MAG: hypothetical protein J3K34DRAFT_167785 [Monoraphidium minutum]
MPLEVPTFDRTRNMPRQAASVMDRIGPVLMLILCSNGLARCAGLQNCKTATNCTRYLSVGLYWGLNNQLLTLVRSMAAARYLGACFVLPSVYIDWKSPYNNSNIQPLGLLFDIDIFVNRSAKLGVVVVPYLPAEYEPLCLAQLQHDLSNRDLELAAEVNLRHRLAQYGVVCLAAHTALVGLSRLGPNGDPFWAALSPAKAFKDIVDNAIHALRTQGVESFVVLQGRIEMDWKQHCKGVNRQRHGRVCYVTPDRMEEYLVEQRLPSSTWVLIASSNGKSHFEAVCNKRPCFSKTDVIDFTKLDPVFSSYITTGAFIDWLLASKAHKVFGNQFSTWYWGVMAYRRVALKLHDPIHTWMYNPSNK